MGQRHWSESLTEEVARRIGGNPDRRKLVDLLTQVGRGMDVVAGRSFHPPQRKTSTIEPNGLPFVDIPDMQIGSMEPVAGVWQIPDPVNKQMASVLQLVTLTDPPPKAAPIADALWIAGQAIAGTSRTGALSKEHVLHWLGTFTHEQRMEIMRRAMDTNVRIYVPILGFAHRGWWIQISRRLIWVTTESEDDGRLLEILLENTPDDKRPPLVATEPVLIAVPMTQQPVDWAFTARIWPAKVRRPLEQPWSKMAKAIHGHGVPTITLDSNSTPYEIACQVLLKSYWHGYIENSGSALANAIAMAYPQPVKRIQRETGAPNLTSAAAILLEQLIHPGFDPTQGAEASRRYVRRKASIAIMEHRKRENPDRYPWTRIGISERHYYKLLPRFANKVNGRYEVDHDDVVARMKAYLDHTENERNVRTVALEVLQSHGFSKDAARKWLQRHRPEEAVGAWPRGQQP